MWRAVALICLAACCLADEPANDWLIVPGVRVGPITAKTTRADLVRIFGAANVADEDIGLDEGETQPGTTLYSSRNSQSVGILWADGMRGKRIEWMFFCQGTEKDCQWHTPDGISLGTSLKQLEKLNGRPFKLQGFEWDEGGSVTSWNGGFLRRKLDRSCGGMALRLDAGEIRPQEQKLYQSIIGEVEFASSRAAMQHFNPTVNYMAVAFRSCAQNGIKDRS